MTQLVRNRYIKYGSIVCIIGIVYMYFVQEAQKFHSITSFEECVRRGYPVLETYPERCKIPGKEFINPHQTSTSSSSQKISHAKENYMTSTYFLGTSTITFYKGVASFGSSTMKIDDRIWLLDITNDGTDDSIVTISHDTLTRKYLGVVYSVTKETSLGSHLYEISHKDTVAEIKKEGDGIVVTFASSSPLYLTLDARGILSERD